PAVYQLARLCHSTENDAAVLESIKSSVVIQRGGNSGRPLLLRPCDIRLADGALAAWTNSHYASGVVRVELSGPLRVLLFGRRLQNNVRRGEKQQTVANHRCAFPTRRQPSYPPSFRSIREVVGHQTLIRLKVASQHDNLVDPVVTPMH